MNSSPGLQGGTRRPEDQGRGLSSGLGGWGGLGHEAHRKRMQGRGVGWWLVEAR